MTKLNRRPSENPYAAPEASDEPDSRIAELLQHEPYVVDGDAVLCRGDLSLQNVCYETGLPAQDSRFFAKKLFAPTVRWNHFFRVSHAFNTIAVIFTLFIATILKWGRFEVFGIPSFVWFWGYVGLMILLLRRVRSVRLFVHRSAEGKRLKFRKITLPAILFGILMVGPIMVVLPWIFGHSPAWGFAAFSGIILLAVPLVMLLPEPQAVVLSNGVFRITGLPPRLLAALRNNEANVLSGDRQDALGDAR